MHQNIHLSAIPPSNRVTASFACDGRSSSLFWSMFQDVHMYIPEVLCLKWFFYIVFNKCIFF